MGIEYPPAIDMFVDPSRVFRGELASIPMSDLSIVIHKTASGAQTTATAIAHYFATNVGMTSSHFIVGKDGSVIQCVSLSDGAAANCCISENYNSYWQQSIDKYSNLNLCTISIEHEDWTIDNSDPMPQAQIDASNKLILWLCQRYKIGTARIWGHSSIDPINRSHCPGPSFSFYQLDNFIHKELATDYILQSAIDTWNSTTHLFGGTPPRRDTGIAEAWFRQYRHAPLPPPLTQEFDSVDWGGTHIVVQLFGHLRAEWYGDHAIWVKADGGL